MTFVSNAQNYEDVLLWRALGHVAGGRYLDIGAQDPVVDSVSLAFFDAGWRGIHLEATPAYAAKLRAARPDETVIEAAVTDAAGPIPFFEIPDTGISTGRPDIAEHHSRAGYQARQIQVPTVRLDHLLDLVDGDIHWMKIDVEGMEADVLRSWGTSECRPWVLVIEATFPNSQEPTHQLWLDEVTSRGYESVFFDGLSCYFVHEAHRYLAAKFVAPANVFDAFVVAAHHFSAGGIGAALSDERQRASREAAEVLRLNQELLASAQRFGDEIRQRELDLIHAHETELIEARWRERQGAQDELRSISAEREDALRQQLSRSNSDREHLNAELARTEERLAHLQDGLALAEERSAQAERLLAETQRQLGGAERQIADTTRSADNMQRELAEARAAAQKAQSEADSLCRDLAIENERLQSSLARANALIAAAVAERPVWWTRAGERIGLLRRRPAWRALSTWRGPTVGGPIASKLTNRDFNKENIQSYASVEARNPYLRANSLAELLSWHDVDFVRCAYVTVLGRQPDPEGEAYYTDRIRGGHSKMEVLWQLRRSPEGPNHDPGIAGFDRALRQHRNANLPMIGYLLRSFRGVDGHSRVAKTFRRISNEMSVLRLEHERVLEQLHAARPLMTEINKNCLADQRVNAFMSVEDILQFSS